jgi:hypothetical protein
VAGVGGGSMIRKTDGQYELICDYCEEIANVFDEFFDAVSYKKAYGWRSVKNNSGDWSELCPDCSTDEIIERLRT